MKIKGTGKPANIHNAKKKKSFILDSICNAGEMNAINMIAYHVLTWYEIKNKFLSF